METGVTFVDGLGVGDVRDVALRDRRHLSEDGVLIVVATIGTNGARQTGEPELIARGFGENEPLVAEMRVEAGQVIAECLDQDITEIKLLQEHIHDSLGAARVRQDGAAADDSPRHRRGLSSHSESVSALRAEPGWADLLVDYAPAGATAQRLVAQLRACQVSALAFCRLLERWARGEASPSTPGAREAALRRAAERGETALSGLDDPLGRYLVELEADQAEGRSWYGEPGRAELVEWQPVLSRAGVHASPVRVAQAYLELAVLVRALEGLRPRRACDRLRTRPTCGRASSTCARTSSTARSKT